MVFINPGFSLGTLDEEGDFVSLATSTDTAGAAGSEAGTVLDKFTKAIKLTLQKLGLIVENGIAQVKELFAEKITTKKLCIGEDGEQICIDKDQLKQLLAEKGTGTFSGGSGGGDGGCTTQTYYFDGDGDGYGYKQGSFQESCVQPDGHVPNNDDCNDEDPNVNPGVAEVCGDGIDNNCDGQVDEGCDTGSDTDTGSEPATTTDDTTTSTEETATTTDEATTTEPVCQPTEEICDGIDNDCDGQIDENLVQQCGSTDIGACQFGTQTCQAGVWGECQGAIEPASEICGDNLDNNCDGQVDEGCQVATSTDTGTESATGTNTTTTTEQ